MPTRLEVLAALKKELKQTQATVDQLGQGIRAVERLGSSGGRPTRVISAAGRRRIAEAQRKRWAKLRAIERH